MKNIIYSLVLISFISCTDLVDSSVTVPETVNLSESFFVHVDLNDRSEDTFKVEMYVGNLSSANDVFQFATAIPGTYSISDVGRFVTNFQAFDENGNEIPSKNISTNQWRITDPQSTHRISYHIKETFEEQAIENDIYAMGGTTMDDFHVLLNTSIVFGYPTGLKERDYYFSSSYPQGWSMGTALPELYPGVYHATDYDFFADSPMLFGDLSLASVNIGTTQVNVYSYSIGGKIVSTQILNDIEQVLFDAKAFLKELPTDHYEFLFDFGEVSAGALEHAYSSVYVLPNYEYSSDYAVGIKNICAHEFFHIVTPLNIHSEIIGDFNFATPTASQHLWLYEGVTEWASDFMQFRNGSTDLDDLLGEMSKKIQNNIEYFDATVSLTNLSTNSYTTQSDQFGNVYNKGAFVVSLLDILLLELSRGKKGMREVVLELIQTYGPNKSFSEAGFFDTFVNMTYPEIEVFIDDYIKGTKTLPIAEYYGKIGIEYNSSSNTLSKMATLSEAQAVMFDAWDSNL